MKAFIVSATRRFLPERAKRAIFNFGFNLAPEQFHLFAFRYANAPNVALSLELLRKRGFSPQIIIDVGAYHGDWTRLAHSVWPKAQITMVEANPAKEEHLKAAAMETGADVQIGLIGARDGEQIDFYTMESGSSVYEECSPLDRKRQTLTQYTLDTVLSNIEKADFIKIDTQGYEIEVLKGATRLLNKTEACLLEVSLIPINKGAPLLHEVVAFMHSLGFIAHEVTEIHRRPLDRATNQIDIFFVRKNSALTANTAHF